MGKRHPMFQPIADNGLNLDRPEFQIKRPPSRLIRILAATIVGGLFFATFLAIAGVVWWLLQFFFI